MKNILVFGAGKSAAYLISYLESLAKSKDYQIVVADSNLQNVNEKLSSGTLVKAIQLDIHNEIERSTLFEKADLVISLMPPTLHYIIALDCLKYKKHFLTASYVDERIKNLFQQIKEAGVLFLFEMGLDPGIDHMSAMKLIHEIKERGGEITSFVSHCGGLVAPESDNNPWHYKISWNPKNIVDAGKAGAVYLEKGKTEVIDYSDIFRNSTDVFVEGLGVLCSYPNRDSLTYIDTYGLNNVSTFKRTTLRYPIYCKAWQEIIELKLTDDTISYDTTDTTVSILFERHLKQTNLIYKYDSIKDDEIKNCLDYFFKENHLSLNAGKSSIASILQQVLEDKLRLCLHDKDMIVMQHEITYRINGVTKSVISNLIVEGENDKMTAMAKTVGLPLGIAAKLILEGKIKNTGLNIPIDATIYEPVLHELESFYIKFKEYETEL